MDVLQVGFGPVSQVLALMLARQGHQVGVVEHWQHAYRLPRAVCIDHEAARILHAIGLGEGLARVCRPAPRYQWFNADWEELLSIDWSASSISGGPAVNFVHQPSLEAELRAEVAKQPKVEVTLGCDMTGFTDHGDHVEVQLRDCASGVARSVRTRYLVGADGANSLTAVIDASIHLGRIICIADPAGAAARDEAFKCGTAEPPALSAARRRPVGAHCRRFARTAGRATLAARHGAAADA